MSTISKVMKPAISYTCSCFASMQKNSASNDVVSIDNELEVLTTLRSNVYTLNTHEIMVEDLRQKLVKRVKDKENMTPIEREIVEHLLDCVYERSRLDELNERLMKNINDVVESGESKKVMEEVIEGIKGLQLAIKEIEYAVLKLDNENDTKEETMGLDVNKLFSLGDYQHNDGSRKETVGATRKKIRFFACFKPRTKLEY